MQYRLKIGGKTVTIGGMCKGSGMIHPNMCTMLGFVTTDASISKEILQEALSQDVKDTLTWYPLMVILLQMILFFSCKWYGRESGDHREG